jgi:signal peptide peptidase SppA
MHVADQLSSLPLPAALKRLLPEPRPRVAVVRLQGVISASASPLSGGALNLQGLEPALKEAFGLPGLQAVALVINSPGGSPTQSALVADRIRGLAAERQLPVLAFCEDLAASGGYWLACAADEIIAHATSLVGSIGVVSGGFGFDELISRYGVERRLHTAGESKARLDPFLKEKPEDVAWLTGELEEMHRLFVEWVRSRRGAKLAADADVFTGEVWTGSRAHGLGLVDELGTLHEVIARRFPKAELTPIQARKSLLSRLSDASGISAGAADAVPALLDALEHRATWARFGR